MGKVSVNSMRKRQRNPVATRLNEKLKMLSLQLFVDFNRCAGYISSDGQQYGICESYKTANREDQFRLGHQRFGI